MTTRKRATGNKRGRPRLFAKVKIKSLESLIAAHISGKSEREEKALREFARVEGIPLNENRIDAATRQLNLLEMLK